MTLAPDPLDNLRIADPDTWQRVRGRVLLCEPPLGHTDLALLTEEVIWALSLEAGFGQILADGLLDLLPVAGQAQVDAYVRLIRSAGRTGATLARIMARHLVPVLKQAPHLLDRFLGTVEVMRGKGTYTLNAPLEILARLLADDQDPESAGAYLDLLATTFRQSLSYNASLRLVYLLPKAVAALAPRRRCFQIRQFERLMNIDVSLADPFVDGLEKGLRLLPRDGLQTFIDQALAAHGRDPDSCREFLSLTSSSGQEACAALQIAVCLHEVRDDLGRYLQARLGRAPAIESLAAAADAGGRDGLLIGSDGRAIFLAPELEHFQSQARNRRLYKLLVRLEAGFFECGTYAFDLQRAADRFPAIAARLASHSGGLGEQACDQERFLDLFEKREPAADLFEVFEQARVAGHLRRRYAGLMHEALPILATEYRRLVETSRPLHPLLPLYGRLVLRDAGDPGGPAVDEALTGPLAELFSGSIADDSPVEASADLVCRAFGIFLRHLRKQAQPYQRLSTPFDRRLRWDWVSRAYVEPARLADAIAGRLADQQMGVYRADLIRRLADRGGLSRGDLADLVFSRGATDQAPALRLDWSRLDLETLLRQAGVEAGADRDDGRPHALYPEWNVYLQEYLRDHARVQIFEKNTDPPNDFYARSLARHRGLVARLKRAFEMLKPEGLQILRPWPEGDAFDYRALLDFAIDRRAGKIPDDRLFIKRLKKQRDVAVMLLVDLSRSTANPVLGGHASVLEVIKTSLVIFCEALNVVGDTFAIAGFSGTGRHSVDFFPTKHFAEPLGEPVRRRIGGLSPQRSTRMGAAVRHASAQLAQASARVRLLLILSDGFPNDLGYKGDYAIADTRRAVQEARAHGQYVKAITVNIGGDARLDELYGRFHHLVIGHVDQLPDKLLRLYSSLTRN